MKKVFFVVFLMLALIIFSSPSGSRGHAAEQQAMDDAGKQPAIYEFEVTATVEIIDRCKAEDLIKPSGGDLNKAGKMSINEIGRRWGSRVIFNTTKGILLEGHHSYPREVIDKIRGDWFGQRREAALAFWEDIKDIKEGDVVKIKVAKVSRDGGFDSYILLSVELMHRPATIKAALVIKYADEEGKKRRLERLEFMREYSGYWKFEFRETRDNLPKYTYSLEIKEAPFISDEEKKELILEFDLPASLTDIFPEMAFEEPHDAILWSVRYREDGKSGLSGQGTGIDVLRYLKK